MPWTKIFQAVKLAVEIVTQLRDAGVLKEANNPKARRQIAALVTQDLKWRSAVRSGEEKAGVPPESRL
jgi:hypothetical protein